MNFGIIIFFILVCAICYIIFAPWKNNISYLPAISGYLNFHSNNTNDIKHYYLKHSETSSDNELKSISILETEYNSLNTRIVSLSSLDWNLMTKNVKNSYALILFISLFVFIFSLYVWISFDALSSGYQWVNFTYAHTYDDNSSTNSLTLSDFKFLDIVLGLDGISLFFLLITTTLTPIAVLAALKDIDYKLKLYLFLLFILEIFQMLVFASIDLLVFYVFFESVLIPLFILIGIWGSSEAKVRAGYLLFLYTLFGSLFMLLSIIKINSMLGSTFYNLISIYEIKAQYIIWIGFFLALWVKTPLWPWTNWLFRAHAEAPLAVSMILAGTILKLATYAYLRILLGFFAAATKFFSTFVQGICFVTLTYASASAVRNIDIKAIVALSSIAHCALGVLGTMSNTINGVQGAILVGISHAFVSPALFICVGGVIYSRIHNRTITYIRGLTTHMPLFSIFFLIFALSNAGLPLTLSWPAEQLSLIGIFKTSPLIGGLAAASILFTAIYSLVMFVRLMFGNLPANLSPLKDLNRLEFNSLLALLIPTIWFGIYTDTLTAYLDSSVSNLIYSPEFCVDNIQQVSILTLLLIKNKKFIPSFSVN
jgi:NADH-ubiquinone oxidoreductase chain 4